MKLCGSYPVNTSSILPASCPGLGRQIPAHCVAMSCRLTAQSMRNTNKRRQEDSRGNTDLSISMEPCTLDLSTSYLYKATYTELKSLAQLEPVSRLLHPWEITNVVQSEASYGHIIPFIVSLVLFFSFFINHRSHRIVVFILVLYKLTSGRAIKLSYCCLQRMLILRTI